MKDFLFTILLVLSVVAFALAALRIGYMMGAGR